MRCRAEVGYRTDSGLGVSTPTSWRVLFVDGNDMLHCRQEAITACYQLSKDIGEKCSHVHIETIEETV